MDKYHFMLFIKHMYVWWTVTYTNNYVVLPRSCYDPGPWRSVARQPFQQLYSINQCSADEIPGISHCSGVYRSNRCCQLIPTGTVNAFRPVLSTHSNRCSQRIPTGTVDAFRPVLSTHSDRCSQRIPTGAVNAFRPVLSTHSNRDSQRIPTGAVNAFRSVLSTHSDRCCQPVLSTHAKRCCQRIPTDAVNTFQAVLSTQGLQHTWLRSFILLNMSRIIDLEHGR